MTRSQNNDVTVNSLDVHKAEEELKSCPLIVRQYVKALKNALDRQKDLTNTAISKIRELSKTEQK